MFRAIPRSSSGGQIVLLQHLVSSLSVSSYSVHRLRADCSFNVKNTVQLIKDLANIPYNQKLRLTSFDISNMYTNIPTEELIKIIKTACQNNNIEDNLARNIINLSKIIIDQNYFQFLDKTYVQTEGLAMGAPTSSIFSELYLQFLEKSTI